MSREQTLDLLGAMLRIRQFEERCAELYGQGKIRGFVHLCNGEEAIAVGVMRELEPHDAVVSTYREHGHALARGVAMNAVMAEMFGKAAGCSGGRGGSMHLFDAANRFYGGNAIVGGGLPLAVGLAMAEKLQGRKGIAACFFGEGAAAEGEFHESLNLAALWTLPVLFVCENNLYAMGTAIERSQVQTSVAARAVSYGLRAESVPGMDVQAVGQASRRAARFVREGGGPALLEMCTYRFRAHSMFDAQLYRSKEEVENWQRRGPIVSLTRRAKAAGVLTEEDYQRLLAAADAEVEEAVRFAEAAPWEPVETLERFVCAEAAP
jgi:pyruvate dehydrogenase E1 component alpha subunit